MSIWSAGLGSFKASSVAAGEKTHVFVIPRQCACTRRSSKWPCLFFLSSRWYFVFLAWMQTKWEIVLGVSVKSLHCSRCMRICVCVCALGISCQWLRDLRGNKRSLCCLGCPQSREKGEDKEFFAVLFTAKYDSMHHLSWVSVSALNSRVQNDS